MPRVARNGDKGIKGVIAIDPELRSHDNRSDEPQTAIAGDFYLCRKHSAPPGGHIRLKNGCQFYKIDGKPVAMQYATKATCSCRIIEGSGVHHCCPHLDDKAKRLAEREMLIEQARDAAEAGAAAGVTPEEAALLNRRADALERLNRDVRFAEMSAAVYQSADAPPSLTKGFGNAPEGMIRLTDPEFRDMLPGALSDKGIVWNDDKSGFHADVYYDELHGSYTVAYRGTDINRPDIVTDIDQAHGLETTQYNEAMKIGDAIKVTVADKRYAGIDLQTTGHSLGGGESAAAGTVGGVPYISWNAAGLHPKTLSRYTEGKLTNADAAPLGVAYNTDYDPLTAAQTKEGSQRIYKAVPAIGKGVEIAGSPFMSLKPFALAAGRLIQGFADWSRSQTGGQLPPTPAATRHELPTYTRDPEAGLHRRLDGEKAWKAGHSILTVLDSIEAEKGGHESALRRLLARAGARKGAGR
jgi:uncharacterized Zn-binding protein involved in type VI secretion